jgi:CHAT domain-containing protein/tetratricopeptide (TPR) repeat protein
MMRRLALRAIACSVLAGASVGRPGPALALAEGETLQPGVAVIRELSPGETHVFQFALDAGEFLEALVEKQGVDVTTTLVEPDGVAVLEVDGTENPMGFERVLWIGRAGGTHSLSIRAQLDRPGGRYKLLLAAPRPVTPNDERRVSAERDLEQVVRWSRPEHLQVINPQVLPEARRRLESALEGFRAVEDRRGEADVLFVTAGLELRLARAKETLITGDQALARYRELQDRTGEAWILQRMGRAHFALGDTRRSLESFQEALRLSRETSNQWAEASYLRWVGILHDHSGDWERAIGVYEETLVKSRASGHRLVEGFALASIGAAYLQLGEYQKALSNYEQALAAFQGLKDTRNEARTGNELANVYSQLGDDGRARDLYLRFLAYAQKENPGGNDEAHALSNLSSLSHRLGEYAEALEQGRRSLEISRRIDDLQGQAYTLHNMAQSLHKVGESEEALTSLREALRIWRERGGRYPEADTLMELAIVERDRGNLREALREAEAAVSLAEELRAAVTNPDLRASFVAAQQDKYGILIDLQMRLHEQDGTAGYDAAALQTSERAKARVLLDTLIEARADIRGGVDAALLDRERALQKQLSEASGRLSSVLTRRGPPEAVAQARQELAAWSEEYRQVQSRIRQESPRYAALTQPVPATIEQIRRELLDEETVLLEFYLGEERSFLWAVTRSELMSQALPKRADIEAAARTVQDLITTRQRTRDLAAVRESDRRLETESMALSRLLWSRLAPRLATDWKAKRLLIVASGALAYLPLGALPSPVVGAARPLLRDHEIVFAPSASVLIALRREHGPGAAAGTSVAVLADPVFDAADPRVRTRAASAWESARVPTGLTRAMASLGRDGFARLPFSRGEADAIATFVPRASLLKATDFAANRTLVAQGALGDHRVVHFATHGLLDSQHPDLSGLVLSLVDEKGKPQDGFLRMHEIYNLRLPVDLVVLSACQTALGREIRGEGLIGLTRGFMYAGARAVVASLWQVDDESTAELMKRFYRAMLKEGRRPADALRTAQIELSRHPRWAAPFYWAPFVLQGDWR